MIFMGWLIQNPSSYSFWEAACLVNEAQSTDALSANAVSLMADGNVWNV